MTVYNITCDLKTGQIKPVLFLPVSISEGLPGLPVIPVCLHECEGVPGVPVSISGRVPELFFRYIVIGNQRI